jgi:transcriptional antiterminator
MIRSRKVNLKNLTHLEDKQLNLNESFHSKLFYDVAKETIQQIEVYLSQKLPEIEIIYLYQYLQSSRIQSSKNTPVHFTEEVIEVTKMYLDNVGKKLGVNTHETVKLTELASHIKPMVNRLLNHIPVRNGLIYEIVSTYGDIFRQVSEVSKQVSKKYGYPVIDDNENGFITLYFANMIERKPVPAKVIIVCTTGIGTSELLKTKVGKNFPELQIVGVVATRNLQKEIEENPDIDLIITTVHLTDLNSYPVVLVSAMFNQEDKSNIRNHLEGLNND